MQERKIYHSSEKQKILEQYIGEWNYSDYTPILHEIFQRRQYEFDISKEEFEEEVRNFVRNVKRISFLSEKKMSNCYASYFFEAYLIGINEDENIKVLPNGNLEWDFEKIFAYLTHEVYHAISHRGKKIGICYQDKNNIIQNLASNEINNEMATCRTSKMITPAEIEIGMQQTIGYTTITPFGCLLSTACGLSERKLLKAGIKSKEEFEEVVCSRFPTDLKEEVLKFLNQYNTNLDIVYELGENERKHKSNSIQEIFDAIYNIAILQIKSENKELTQEYIYEINYRYYKMKQIAQLYEKDISFDGKQCERITSLQKSLHSVVEELNKKFKLQENIQDNNITEEDENFPISKEYKRKVIMEEFGKSNVYDNAFLEDIICDIVINTRKFKKIQKEKKKEKRKSFISRFINRNKGNLSAENAVAVENVQLQNEFDGKYKVNPKDLKTTVNVKAELRECSKVKKMEKQLDIEKS